jgi:hypothetical protein
LKRAGPPGRKAGLPAKKVDDAAYRARPHGRRDDLPGKGTRKQTAAERVVSLAQWYATRKTRGTMGKKQRRAITAEGKPGVIIVTPDGTPIGGRPPVPPKGK